MRIHTDTLTEQDIHRATNLLPGVYATVSAHGSRSRKTALEMSLTGNGYARNTGQYGAGDEAGATWDEWGVVLAELFALDPKAFAGSAKHPVYRDQADYDQKTRYRFGAGEGLPEDTHKRHNWKPTRPGHFQCSKCSAQMWNGFGA